MINLHDVSVITTATIDSPDRLRNTALFLKYFETFCSNYEIIVVEQDRHSQLEQLTNGRAGVFHHFIESENCHSRAKNLNFAACLSERKYVLICDLDIFIPPSSLEKALSMIRSGADFVLPYNGVVVQVKKAAIDQDMDLRELVNRLVYFSRMHEVRPPQYDPEIFEHLYGSVLSDTVGGIMMCQRRQFFLAGAMNENMISFGCEEGEFYHRIRKLGYKVDRIDEGNGYHYEHVRPNSSMKNNFYRSNQAELERVRAMEPGELRRYANDGFKRVKLDTTYDLTLMNTPTLYMIKVELPDRISLPDICTVLVFENSSKDDVNAVEKFFDYMESTFDNYCVFVVEGEFSRFRVCLARKYAQHVWHRAPLQELSDEDIRALVCTERSIMEIYRFKDRFDPSVLTRRYDPARFTTGNPALKILRANDWAIQDGDKM